MIGTQTLHQRIVKVCCGNSGEIGEVTAVSLLFEPSSEGPTIIIINPAFLCDTAHLIAESPFPT